MSTLINIVNNIGTTLPIKTNIIILLLNGLGNLGDDALITTNNNNNDAKRKSGKNKDLTSEVSNFFIEFSPYLSEKDDGQYITYNHIFHVIQHHQKLTVVENAWDTSSNTPK